MPPLHPNHLNNSHQSQVASMSETGDVLLQESFDSSLRDFQRELLPMIRSLKEEDEEEILFNHRITSDFDDDDSSDDGSRMSWNMSDSEEDDEPAAADATQLLAAAAATRSWVLVRDNFSPQQKENNCEQLEVDPDFPALHSNNVFDEMPPGSPNPKMLMSSAAGVQGRDALVEHNSAKLVVEVAEEPTTTAHVRPQQEQVAKPPPLPSPELEQQLKKLRQQREIAMSKSRNQQQAKLTTPASLKSERKPLSLTAGHHSTQVEEKGPTASTALLCRSTTGGSEEAAGERDSCFEHTKDPRCHDKAPVAAVLASRGQHGSVLPAESGEATCDIEQRVPGNDDMPPAEDVNNVASPQRGVLQRQDGTHHVVRPAPLRLDLARQSGNLHLTDPHSDSSPSSDDVPSPVISKNAAWRRHLYQSASMRNIVNEKTDDSNITEGEEAGPSVADARLSDILHHAPVHKKVMKTKAMMERQKGRIPEVNILPKKLESRLKAAEALLAAQNPSQTPAVLAKAQEILDSRRPSPFGPETLQYMLLRKLEKQHGNKDTMSITSTRSGGASMPVMPVPQSPMSVGDSPPTGSSMRGRRESVRVDPSKLPFATDDPSLAGAKSEPPAAFGRSHQRVPEEDRSSSPVIKRSVELTRLAQARGNFHRKPPSEVNLQNVSRRSVYSGTSSITMGTLTSSHHRGNRTMVPVGGKSSREALSRQGICAFHPNNFSIRSIGIPSQLGPSTHSSVGFSSVSSRRLDISEHRNALNISTHNYVREPNLLTLKEDTASAENTSISASKCRLDESEQRAKENLKTSRDSRRAPFVKTSSDEWNATEHKPALAGPPTGQDILLQRRLSNVSKRSRGLKSLHSGHGGDGIQQYRRPSLRSDTNEVAIPVPKRVDPARFVARARKETNKEASKLYGSVLEDQNEVLLELACKLSERQEQPTALSFQLQPRQRLQESTPTVPSRSGSALYPPKLQLTTTLASLGSTEKDATDRALELALQLSRKEHAAKLDRTEMSHSSRALSLAMELSREESPRGSAGFNASERALELAIERSRRETSARATPSELSWSVQPLPTSSQGAVAARAQMSGTNNHFASYGVPGAVAVDAEGPFSELELALELSRRDLETENSRRRLQEVEVDSALQLALEISQHDLEVPSRHELFNGATLESAREEGHLRFEESLERALEISETEAAIAVSQLEAVMRLQPAIDEVSSSIDIGLELSRRCGVPSTILVEAYPVAKQRRQSIGTTTTVPVADESATSLDFVREESCGEGLLDLQDDLDFESSLEMALILSWQEAYGE